MSQDKRFGETEMLFVETVSTQGRRVEDHSEVKHYASMKRSIKASVTKKHSDDSWRNTVAVVGSHFNEMRPVCDDSEEEDGPCGTCEACFALDAWEDSVITATCGLVEGWAYPTGNNVPCGGSYVHGVYVSVEGDVLKVTQSGGCG